MPADSRDMVLVPREPTEEMIWEGALAAMEAATEFIEDGFWKDRHLRAIERMRSGDYGSEDDHAKGLKVGSALYRAALSASPARGEGEPERMLCNICKRPVNAGHPSEWCTCQPYMAPAGTHDAPSPGEGDAPGLTVEIVDGPPPLPGVPSYAIRKWDNHGLKAGTYRLFTHPTPATPAGWIVSNANGDRWRTWEGGFSAWTDDREKATRYARREDAEAVHAEDEDAWRIEPYGPATPAGEELREKVARIVCRIVRTYQNHEWPEGYTMDMEVENAWDDWLPEVDAILAALQPQAEGE